MSRRKHTTLRFLTLVMATITSFSLFATAQGVIIDNTYEQLMLLQEDAVAANELLNESFGHDAVGNITFPNDFAGARIEENKLVLSLTNTGIDNTTKYSPAEDIKSVYYSKFPAKRQQGKTFLPQAGAA